jgi:hypothetical protein
MNACRISKGKPERKRPVVKHRCRGEDSFKLYFKEKVRGSMDWIDLTAVSDNWRVFVNTATNLPVT